MLRAILFFGIAVLAFATACGPAVENLPNANHANHNAANSNANAAPGGPLNLTTVDTPQRIKDTIAGRGKQDAASPVLKIESPAEGSTVNNSTVPVRLDLSGDLKGYKPSQDPQTKMGNHIHVILDNQPYEAYYNIDGGPFELRNVPDGEHTLRVFASRPWHESYKNDGSFQMVKFTVKNGNANTNQPATTNSGQQMSNANSNANVAPAPEGKAMQATQAGAIDAKKPLLTYSRPKGEYKEADADPIMIDFWLSNARLDDGMLRTGGSEAYRALPVVRVRYSVNGGEPQYIDEWKPIWLQGWTAGKHSIRLELVDKDGNVVDNGGYNSTTREITVVK